MLIGSLTAVVPKESLSFFYYDELCKHGTITSSLKLISGSGMSAEEDVKTKEDFRGLLSISTKFKLPEILTLEELNKWIQVFNIRLLVVSSNLEPNPPIEYNLFGSKVYKTLDDLLHDIEKF